MYFHDEETRTIAEVKTVVYRENRTKENKSYKRRRLGWIVTAEVELTTAGNQLKDGQWEHATSKIVIENYDSKDSKEKVKSNFNGKLHKTLGNEITKEQYEELKDSFEKSQKEM